MTVTCKILVGKCWEARLPRHVETQKCCLKGPGSFTKVGEEKPQKATSTKAVVIPQHVNLRDFRKWLGLKSKLFFYDSNRESSRKMYSTINLPRMGWMQHEASRNPLFDEVLWLYIRACPSTLKWHFNTKALNFWGVGVVTLFEEMFLIFLGSIEVSQALKSTQLRWQWDDIEACLSHEKGEKWHRKYEVTWHETVQGPKKMAQELRLHGSYGDAISLQSVFVSRDFSNSNCLRILPKWQGHGCCYGAGLEEANLPRGINHLYRNHGYILYAERTNIYCTSLWLWHDCWWGGILSTCNLGGWPAWPCSIVSASILGRFRAIFDRFFHGYLPHENEDG